MRGHGLIDVATAFGLLQGHLDAWARSEDQELVDALQVIRADHQYRVAAESIVRTTLGEADRAIAHMLRVIEGLSGQAAVPGHDIPLLAARLRRLQTERWS